MDFCMRASIPALILLYLLIIQTLDISYIKKDYLIITILTVLLLVGSVTSSAEFHRTISKTSQEIQEGLTLVGLRESDENILMGYNFSGNVNNNLFFQYFSKSYQ